MNNKLGKKKKRRLLADANPTSASPEQYLLQEGGLVDKDDTQLYKYVSSQFINNVFDSPEHVTLKCSLPKDFNDPYELFLTIDFDEEPDALAFYADAVGDLDQMPTTCFSRSPDVVPMWAHYAENHKGFVIEFSEKCLTAAFPDSNCQDVTYSDAASEDLTDMLYRAFKIGKYRYVYLLRLGVYNAAYFTKATCWSYERERRMVAAEKEVRDISGVLLLNAPVHCVRSIIVGARATHETKQALLTKSQELGCHYFEMRIGKSSANPYFIDAHEQPYIFDGSTLKPAASSCETCFEPMKPKNFHGQCSWCRIDEQVTEYAASRNPYRMLHRAGLLESYIQGMDEITFGRRKTDSD